MIALTKTLDPTDLDDPAMRNQLVIVDKHFDLEHVQRRWEYALALVALQEWYKRQPEGAPYDLRLADVGGAGSPFHLMTGWRTTIIDPNLPHSDTVEEIASRHLGVYDAVFALSTFEHTKNPLAFLEACHQILKPGGLLFLTFDYIEGNDDLNPKDVYHFHWMRERIMNQRRAHILIELLRSLYDYALFGAADNTPHGPHVYDYTFASLCLRKPA